ncbi:hypothetical protein ATY79_27105 [Rhizobium sp. R693]|nr:hypothetical protein ATY79_27105 [Rhizobium sp. R693]
MGWTIAIFGSLSAATRFELDCIDHQFVASDLCRQLGQGIIERSTPQSSDVTPDLKDLGGIFAPKAGPVEEYRS